MVCNFTFLSVKNFSSGFGPLATVGTSGGVCSGVRVSGGVFGDEAFFPLCISSGSKIYLV